MDNLYIYYEISNHSYVATWKMKWENKNKIIAKIYSNLTHFHPNQLTNDFELTSKAFCECHHIRNQQLKLDHFIKLQTFSKILQTDYCMIGLVDILRTCWIIINSTRIVNKTRLNINWYSHANFIFVQYVQQFWFITGMIKTSVRYFEFVGYWSFAFFIGTSICSIIWLCCISCAIDRIQCNILIASITT